MRIAILYICTGKYSVFFDVFYKTSEKYFLSGVEKTYFVFSDNQELAMYDKVSFHFKECEGFPKDSLFRFRTFLTVEQELQNYDYVFFFNSNMKFVEEVDAEILPTEQDGWLCCLDAEYEKYYPHPCFFPYERNKKSLAYVPRGLSKYRYYHAGVNGGRVKEYMEFSRTLMKNIEDDYNRGIVAVYHDESHVNKFFSEHSCKSLYSEYGAAEGTSLEKDAKLIITDKTKYDAYFNKGRSSSIGGKLKKSYKLILHIIKWYI